MAIAIQTVAGYQCFKNYSSYCIQSTKELNPEEHFESI